MSDIDLLLRKFSDITPEEYGQVADNALQSTAGMRWIPNPGPQTAAYFCEADQLLYGGEPGGGKGTTLNTPIATPYGWSTIGELRVGDEVFSEIGERCRVIAKSEIYKEPTYRIAFSDGSEIIVGERHQWVTSTRAERQRALKSTDEWRADRRATRPSRIAGNKSAAFVASISARNAQRAKSQDLPTRSVKTTAQIAQTLKRYDGALNHAVALAGPLQVPCAELLIDPYVLGAWLGDGSKTSGVLAGVDEDIFTQVANAGYVVTHHASGMSRGVLGLIGRLKQIGVHNNKHIPPAYLRASYDQRLALLQGLMDTDGHCDTRGQCEIQLTRKELIDGVHELLCSLGIKTQMREGEAKIYGRVTSQKWRLKFQTDLPAFRLARKLIRQKRSNFRGTHDVRYIATCDPVEQVPLQCIQVDAPSHCYLIGRTMIPTHNSQLLLGLAFNCHQRSLIMRRQYTDLGQLTEDGIKINGSRAGFNGSPPPKLKISERQFIDFAAAARVGDEHSWMGRSHDFIGVDEATQLARAQIRFLLGWLRTEDPAQHCRAVLATNPPLTAEGLWVIEMFAPWLDPRYPNPAKAGELRWFVTDEYGNDKWVPGPAPVQLGGKMLRPLSRTYISASVKDNPHYVATDYQRQLDAMPEPFRSILLGGFRTSFRDQPNQCIPTKWVQLAQERWMPAPPEDVPMCAIGVDCSGGGEDPMVLAPRYDGWYDEMRVVPGHEIPMERAGAFCAGIVLEVRRDAALVIVDMGGGYGGPVYEHLATNDIQVSAYKGAEASTKRTADRKLKFTNKRSAAIWAFREALDPGQPGGSPISLPPDPELVADLTSPTFEVTPNGIKVEPKEDVCKRLGRSTNKGDAACMAWFDGARHTTHAEEWIDRGMAREMRGQRPKVLISRTPLSVRGMNHGR